MKSKVLNILLAVVIAFGLWTYVVTVVSPEWEATFGDIPVILQGEGIMEERALMITTENFPTVSLRLEGKRSDMSKLSKDNISIIVDVSKVDKAGLQNLRYDVVFPGDVPDNAVSIMSQYPSTISLQVEERISKNVDVVIEYSGQLKDGYMYDKENVELDSTAVNVKGPKSVVDQISKAVIEVDLNERSESFIEQFSYTLCNEENEAVDVHMIETNVEAVNLTMKIQQIKEIPLVLNVIDGGGATKDTSSITVDPRTIWISGNEAVLEGIEELVLGTIDLSEYLEDTTLVFPVELPEGVNNESELLEATVEIKFPDLAVKTLNVTKIEAINVPEGLEAEMITAALEVRVRGPKSLIGTFSASDLSVTVDFADADVGTAKMKAVITIQNSKYDRIGVVGSYTVSAVLREPLPEPSEPTEQAQNLT